VISEFEVNPFVFDAGGSLVAIDGLAVFREYDEVVEIRTEPRQTNLDAFFEPNGIAVVGVSATDKAKMGNIIATILHNLGRSDLHMVNPKGGTVTIQDTEYPLHTSLTEIETPVDLVIVNVPAAGAPAVIEDAKAKHVRAAILIPGGFSELHGDTTLEDKILDLVRGTDMRLIGPNCMGVFYAGDDTQPGVNTWFIPKFKLEIVPKEKSNVAFLTQSGALGVTILDKLKYAMYPRVLVSYGNQIDVDGIDLLAYFDRDPRVEVISLYIEGFTAAAGRRFCDAARSASKPVVVYKAGRTDAGSKAAASHTASMTGDYEIAEAAFKQAGVIVADTLEDLTEYIKTFALLSDMSVSGRRVAGLANAGFESTCAADNLGTLTPARFTEETTERLRTVLPPMVGVNPFLDITPMGNDQVYEGCLGALLEDPGVDCVFVSIVPHTPMLKSRGREIEAHEENVAARIVRQVQKHKKPVVVSMNAGTYHTLRDTLERGGVPTYPDAKRAMQCLDMFVTSRLGT
jgi:acyl-CoA synthetase (NDP forming)